MRKESALSIQKLAAISPDKAELLIDTHILTEDLSLDSLVSRGIVPTLSGEELAVQQIGEEVYIGKARVVEGDIKVDNGVIHVLDSVLVPNFVYNFLTENQPQLASSVGIEVYPNPFQQDFTLTYPEAFSKDGEVSLMNPTGKIIQSWSIKGVRETIPAKHLPSGVYLLIFDMEGKKYSELILKK